MKLILASIFACTLFANSAVADQPSYMTEFNLTTKVGSSTSKYSNNTATQVVLPAGVNWVCVSVPVSLSADGSVFTGGFTCVNENDDYLHIEASCYTGRSDYERQAVDLSKTSEYVGTVRFQAQCRTYLNTPSRPTIRG